MDFFRQLAVLFFVQTKIEFLPLFFKLYLLTLFTFFSTYLYKKYTHATKLQRWWLIPLGVIQIWGGRVYSNYLYFILKTDAQQVSRYYLIT